MNIYLISQTSNADYDTFDSAVVCAPDEETARHINPRTGGQMFWTEQESTWCEKPEQVTVKLLGAAADGVSVGVVCASYNAG